MGKLILISDKTPKDGLMRGKYIFLHRMFQDIMDFGLGF